MKRSLGSPLLGPRHMGGGMAHLQAPFCLPHSKINPSPVTMRRALYHPWHKKAQETGDFNICIPDPQICFCDNTMACFHVAAGWVPDAVIHFPPWEHVCVHVNTQQCVWFILSSKHLHLMGNKYDSHLTVILLYGRLYLESWGLGGHCEVTVGIWDPLGWLSYRSSIVCYKRGMSLNIRLKGEWMVKIQIKQKERQ